MLISNITFFTLCINQQILYRPGLCVFINIYLFNKSAKVVGNIYECQRSELYFSIENTIDAIDIAEKFWTEKQEKC